MNLNNIISQSLRDIANDIDNGKYKCDDDAIEQAIDLLNSLNTLKLLSKEQSCKYLNVSRSTFDTYIRNGWIPRGLKRLGFKELSWTKTELDKAIQIIQEKEKN